MTLHDQKPLIDLIATEPHITDAARDHLIRVLVRELMGYAREHGWVPVDPMIVPFKSYCREQYPALYEKLYSYPGHAHGGDFEDAGCPMVVACTSCEMTMAVISCTVDLDTRLIYCKSCAPANTEVTR